jgi:hypothetical protein
MERDPHKRYAQSLEKTIDSNYRYLKETIRDFHEMCQTVSPERRVPQDIVLDIRRIYKDIRDRLTEIKAIENLLQGKYRQYYHRDAMRDKEILEISFIAKNSYSKFEYVLMQKEVQKKAKEREGALKEEEQKELPYQWFNAKGNQVTFIRNLRILNELDYERPSDLETVERREAPQDRPRSLTLFVFSGEGEILNTLQSQIRLREHDILERYSKNELHGVLTHLREIDPSDIERMFKAFIGRQEFSSLKCLLLTVYSLKDLEGDVWIMINRTLQEMREGEIKTLIFPEIQEISDFKDLE